MKIVTGWKTQEIEILQYVSNVCSLYSGLRRKCVLFAVIFLCFYQYFLNFSIAIRGDMPYNSMQVEQSVTKWGTWGQ
jgi:TRAP-type mannitol/chloroaromatic compound transport system permease small subunit